MHMEYEQSPQNVNKRIGGDGFLRVNKEDLNCLPLTPK